MAKSRTKQHIKTKRTIRRKKQSGVGPYIFVFCLIALLFGAYKFAPIYFQRTTEEAAPIHQVTIPAGFPSFGIDISHHQGDIDWDHLLVNNRYDTLIKFVYCKATEGTNHIDRNWQKNRAKLKKLRIAHGAYHFFSPNQPVMEQANHFLNQWQKTDEDLPPVLDVETAGTSTASLITAMKIWLQQVERKTGMRPIIYTSLHFFETKFKQDFAAYKFWIAAYSRKPVALEDSRVIHWQYSETGKLPGINELVDFNVSKINYW
jgi:lysozyme